MTKVVFTERSEDSSSISNLRVAILYNTSWYVYLLRKNLITSMIEAGVSVSVISPIDAYTDRVKALGVRHIPIKMSPRSTNPLREAATCLDVLRAIREVRPHYVLSFTVKCNLYAGIVNKFIRFEQIANVSGLGEAFDRGGLAVTLVKSLYRISLSKAHRIFFQNPEDREMCLRNRLVPTERSVLLPGSGVDLTHFKPTPPSGEGPRTFLMFGRFLPKKGFRSFLAAAEALKPAFGDRVRFQVLGSADPERPESLALYEDLRSAHARGSIELLPPTDNVLPIVQGASAVVLPSTYNEGVPRSLLEALACAKPIITTDWKGCRETVQDGVNGFLLDPSRLDQALTEAVEALVTTPSEALRGMGEASRKLAETRFDERRVLHAYLSGIGLAEDEGAETLGRNVA